jgi:cell division septation protein DedD
MNSAYEFTLSKRRLILLAACLAASGMLFFCAGLASAYVFDNLKPNLNSAPIGNPSRGVNSTLEKAPEPHKIPAENTAAETVAKQHSESGLLVQVACFHAKARADRFASALKRQGLSSVYVIDVSTSGEPWYAVRSGPYIDWDSASQAAAEIGNVFSIQTQLVGPIRQ